MSAGPQGGHHQEAATDEGGLVGSVLKSDLWAAIEAGDPQQAQHLLDVGAEVEEMRAGRR